MWTSKRALAAMILHRSLWALTLLALAACETPYQETGLFGGVSAARISDDTAQIEANGNGYTDPATIQRYALRRAAEETLNDGFDLFQIETTEDVTRTGSESFGSASSTRYGVIASGFSMPIVKPGQVLMIRMLHGPAPDPLPEGEFDAHRVVDFLGKTDHRDCATVGDKVVCK